MCGSVSGMTATPCGNIRHVSGVEGEAVVLAVDYTDIIDISWTITSNYHQLATTIPGEPIDIRDEKYKGRLDTTANGSLIIDKLTRENQRRYLASILRDGSGVCNQDYNLTVYSAQSRDSYITHAASVGKEFMIHTGQGFNQTRMDYTTENTIRLAISGCVLLIACFSLTHHMNTEVMSPSTNTHEMC